MSTAFQIEGDIVQGDIRFRESTHEYFHIPTGRKLASVSQVINTVFNLKSWDGVDPAIVENARIRGSAVDAYLTRYVRNQRLDILNELEDVTQRVVIAHRIWEQEFHGLPAEPQKIVYSLEDGIAGTMDFFVDNRIVVDLKNTYSLEKSVVLQLGAYVEYAPVDPPPSRCGIIHVSPKVYRNGGKWIEYDVAMCRTYWRAAVDWWQMAKMMKGEKK